MLCSTFEEASPWLPQQQGGPRLPMSSPTLVTAWCFHSAQQPERKLWLSGCPRGTLGLDTEPSPFSLPVPTWGLLASVKATGHRGPRVQPRLPSTCSAQGLGRTINNKMIRLNEINENFK